MQDVKATDVIDMAVPRNHVQFLQNSTGGVKTSEEANKMLDQIAAIIREETSGQADSCESVDGLVNQVVLNLAFRNYYALLERFKLHDQHFAKLTQQLQKESDFLMLYAVLLTNHCQCLDVEQLRNKCLEAITKVINENSTPLLAIVKALNLMCRKFPKLEVNIKLEHIYYMLQSQIVGMREETIIIFRHCVRDSQWAIKSFVLINDYWPWTNKNKYYLVSCILGTQTLQQLLAVNALQSTQDFFNGLRLSLNYKRLFAASQYLVKALSCQESEELLQLSVKILTHGTRKEIINFHAQWFSRINQKDALFTLLQQQLEIADALQRSNMLADDTQRYRLILLFSMFSRQVFQLSKLHFFKISTELITNCFLLVTDAQLLVFKFVVDNLTNFAIEDCLEFLLCFIRTHKCVDTAQYRNNILGKLPTIINYISKTYGRLDAEDASTLKGSIRNFFMALQQIVEEDAHSTQYQPKIFALKLLEILIQSLYLQTPIKNAKNCSIAQNQCLGRFLVEQEQVFNSTQMQSKLLMLLHDPLGFDDALELLVTLLKQLDFKETKPAAELCLQVAQHCDLDECALSTLFAAVAVSSFCAAQKQVETLQLFRHCFDTLHDMLPSFIADPLLVCKTRHHLFGFLEAINICVAVEMQLFEAEFKTLLKLLENVLNTVLKMLNLAAQRSERGAGDSVANAASFQDIDESLQLLVCKSTFDVADNHQDCRKFLLMSFWLTLKACCELATTIGCHLVSSSNTNAEHLELLEQCLQINVSVLTKCRHKGAIEAAGLAIGKLTKCLTKLLSTKAKGYQLLHNCLDLLFFEQGQQISTTRRGAGLSIMFLHVVKNEEKRTRPLLRLAVRKILARLKHSFGVNAAENYDCLEALTLHYLCVLVKDTELREPMSKYHDDIMMAAIAHIDNPEWTICNAALQLFGALVPKIVGQKQATEFEEPVSWEPTEVTYMEITLRLPQTCAFILHYCDDASKKQASGACIRSIILFLEFLARVEHLKKSEDNTEHSTVLLDQFRELMWSLLSHKAEKVRKLAATCFVRAHEFRCDLPLALLEISTLLFSVQDENFFQGLTYVLIEGTHKIQHESLHSLDSVTIEQLFSTLQLNLTENFDIKQRNLYSLCKLLDLLLLLGFTQHSALVQKLVNIDNSRNCIGKDVWQEKLAEII